MKVNYIVYDSITLEIYEGGRTSQAVFDAIELQPDTLAVSGFDYPGEGFKFESGAIVSIPGHTGFKGFREEYFMQHFGVGALTMLTQAVQDLYNKTGNTIPPKINELKDKLDNV